MLEELIKYNLGEKLDKQLVDRLPYFLFASVIFFEVNVYLNQISPGDLPVPVGGVPYLFGFGIAITLILSHRFNQKINEDIDTGFDYSNFDKLTAKISKIFEKNDSLYSDLKDNFRLNKTNIALGFLSGVSLFLTFYLLFYMVLEKIRPDAQYLAIGMGICSLFIYKDISKLEYFKSEEKPTEISGFVEDLLEAYTVKNTARNMPISKNASESLFFAASKLIGPLVYFNLPKYSFSSLLIYDTEDFRSYLSTMESTGEQELKLIRGKTGDSTNMLNGAYSGKQKISLIMESSPRENYPFLFGQTNRTQPRNWISWYIQDGGKRIGCMILTEYKGAFVKRRLRRGKTDITMTPRVVYQILLMGERAQVEHLKSQISLRGPSFNTNMLQFDIDD